MLAEKILTALYDLWAEENGKQIEINVEEINDGRCWVHQVVNGKLPEDPVLPVRG